jgi:hypothetical protein
MDAAVFMTSAWLLVAGRAPYGGAWDHKPPLAGLVDLPAVLLPLTDPWPVVWLLSTAMVIATSIVVAFVVDRSVRSSPAAAAAGLLCAFGMAADPISAGGGLSEVPAALLASLAVLAAIRSPSVRGAVIAGILSAAAIGSSLLAVAVTPAVLLALRAGATPGEWGRRAASSVFSAAGVGASVALLLAVGGVLPNAVDQLVRYNAAFGQLNGSHADQFLVPLGGAALSTAMLWIPALIGLSSATLRSNSIVAPALAWVASLAVAILLSRRVEAHYFVLAAPPLSALVGVGVAGKLRRVRLGWAVGAGVSAVFLAAWLQSAAFSAFYAAPASQRDAAAYVSANASGDSSVYVWGDAPAIYVWARRLPAGPYTYSFPLITPGYSTSEQVDDLLRIWRSSPPAVVVDAGGGGPALLVARPVYHGDGRDLDLLEPLRTFVEAHYRLATTVDGIRLYEYEAS